MTKINSKSILLVVGALVVVGSLASCHTMHGLGQDLSSGGRAIAYAPEPDNKHPSKVVVHKVLVQPQSQQR